MNENIQNIIYEVPYVIYQFWTGDNPISENRLNAQKTSSNLGVKIKFLNKKDIEQYILKNHPLHPIYQYLSYNHQSDYLRSYFMNFYGGGYADIKYFSKDNNWKECFEFINKYKNIDIVGKKECINGSSIKELNKKVNRKKLLSNGWFICRPHSKFTEEWYKRVQNHCDEVFELAKSSPATLAATWNRDKNYKLKWSEMQCDIFHPLCYEYYDTGCISNMLINGKCNNNYR